MFASELTLILTNLLTNAVKATEDSGRILCWSKSEANSLFVTLENTGEKVDLSESDRWFHPFESKSTAPDPILGVGMGMGLPITRNMIETYGGQINFVRPSRGFSTAISFSLPRK
jgi:signal transduction histidine kinase